MDSVTGLKTRLGLDSVNCVSKRCRYCWWNLVCGEYRLGIPSKVILTVSSDSKLRQTKYGENKQWTYPPVDIHRKSADVESGLETFRRKVDWISGFWARKIQWLDSSLDKFLRLILTTTFRPQRLDSKAAEKLCQFYKRHFSKSLKSPARHSPGSLVGSKSFADFIL